MDLYERFVEGKPKPTLEEMFRPKHEATVTVRRGRFRWTCICGDQQTLPPTDDMDAVMRDYARHTGLVEKGK